MITDYIFDLTGYRIDQEPHITVNREVCLPCTHRACTFTCPAGCYQWNENSRRIDFAHESCLECGTCLIICDKEALQWNYPKGGFGVRFRLT
jgi:ferredoxin like protein